MDARLRATEAQDLEELYGSASDEEVSKLGLLPAIATAVRPATPGGYSTSEGEDEPAPLMLDVDGYSTSEGEDHPAPLSFGALKASYDPASKSSREACSR